MSLITSLSMQEDLYCRGSVAMKLLKLSASAKFLSITAKSFPIFLVRESTIYYFIDKLLVSMSQWYTIVLK